MIKTEHSRSE